MRDYRPAAKKRRSPPRRKQKESRLGFGAGLTLGLAIAGLVALYDRVDWRQWLVAGTPPNAQRTPAAAPNPSTAPRFDFYTMLSEMEVAVPEERLSAAPAKPTDTKDSPASEEAHTYVLQVGSFRQYEDADRLKATLALMGNQARIHQVTIDGANWHRVRLGPYNDLNVLNGVRSQLAAEKIPTIALQLK
ncbi:MAG: SPOR domain-containing protein [Gammaproteobacteria bacterium]|nr:SPOR domain-containing protein [Gammaproteobacteria bacterium]